MTETFRVFLSSTGGDLDTWRDAVAAALWRKDGVEVIRMEDFVATGLPPIALCLDKVAACQIFVGLIGFRYGSAIPGRVTSFTQAEYEEAVRLGLPCLMYVAPAGGDLDTDHGEEAEVRGRLDRLRARVMRANTAGRPEAWANADALALHVVEALQQEIERQRAASAPGFTQKKYGARIKGRLEQIAELMAAEDAERDQLANEKAELERRLSDLDAAFADAEARIQELEALLTREGNHLGSERLERAEKALADGDFDEADKLLAEIEDDEELAIKRAARAAFGRGKIAEERVKWHDAADHYAKAARLDPCLEHIEKAGTLLWIIARYDEAVRMNEDMLNLAEREHGPKSWVTARALNNLGLRLKALGRSDEAETLFRRAIALEGLDAEQSPTDAAAHLTNLSTLLIDTGRMLESEPIVRRSLSLFRESIPEAAVSYAVALSNLAMILESTDRAPEAEIAYRDALIAESNANISLNRDRSSILSNFAMMLRDLGRFDEAKPLLEEALEVDRATIGAEHPDHAIRLNNLAQLYRDTGDTADATRLFEEAVRVLRQTVGDEHSYTAKISGNWASFLRKHFPDDPAIAELEEIFGPDIGRGEG
ncbi:MAG: tetratricopeptide repeat protein [Pseudomonadota bacterium]